MPHRSDSKGAPSPPPASSGREPPVAPRPFEVCYAALDLGTNNCRLLIATPAAEGFRVVESFSRIVRLGDGLSHSGRLDEAAMERTLRALTICAEKIERRHVAHVRAVATQACRAADNGPEFIARIERETGIVFDVIAPREEARLSVAGCLNLLDRTTDAALVVDVGGGSTELAWVDLRPDKSGRPKPIPPIGAWLSIPIGVVTLAERFPEKGPVEGASADLWFRAMVDHMKARITAFKQAEGLRPIFDAERAHLVGTSGAITSLAGMHLGLKRYERARVDGLWLTHDDCTAAAELLMRLGAEGRAAEPCIGPDRADLVLAGAAILQAVQECWPCPRVRVADRGLREGILLSMMAERRAAGPKRHRRRGRRRASGRGEAAVVAGV
jgi:exopolyphosphatase/guanosine-5'-triphosphate,3'-diphosphate pyrophosphatase